MGAACAILLPIRTVGKDLVDTYEEIEVDDPPFEFLTPRPEDEERDRQQRLEKKRLLGSAVGGEEEDKVDI